MPWFGVIWIKVCGTWLGYPSKRRRNLSWSWNRDRLIWTGPAEQKDVQADFDRLFHRKIMLPGDVFCAAPDEYVAGVYGHAMGKRVCSLPDGQNVDVRGRRMLASILTPAQLQRLHAYEETHEAKHGTPPGPGSPLIADVMQWPGMPGDSSGAVFPSQLKHGLYYSFAARRLLMGLEGMFANGFNVFEPDGAPWSSPLTPMLRRLSQSQIKHLSGNGMHCPSVCAWFVYVCMNTRRVESSKLVEEARLAKLAEGFDHDDEGDDEGADHDAGDADVMY
jgi:hypothetical protein